MIRDILLVIYAVGWLVVLVVTVVQTKKAPAGELWGALGLGVGAIMGLFPRSVESRRRDRAGDASEAVEDKPT